MKCEGVVADMGIVEVRLLWSGRGVVKYQTT